MKALQIGNLTIPVPIVQGAMGIGISLSGLSSAVATAGGVGTIATVGVGLVHGKPEKSFRENNIDGIIKEIRLARKLSNGVLGVNIMTALTNYSELVETAIKEKIDIIFSGAGLPLDLPRFKTRGSNTKLVPIVSSGRAARLIAKKWIQNFQYVPDAFVLEGPEAGGHLGFSHEDLVSDKFCLEELVKDTVTIAEEFSREHQKHIPVIAGGGVSSGVKMREIINLGASAVQVGSNFITTRECDASNEFKQAILQSSKDDICLIKSPVGLPGRAINNDFLLAAERGEKMPGKCKYSCLKTCNPKTTKYCIADALLSAFHGKFDSGFAFSGANAYLIESISSVDEVFRRYISEYNNSSETSINEAL